MVHLSCDRQPVTAGARFWDNNLRVVEITGVATSVNKHEPSGCTQTWHETTDGISDTMDGHMLPYGRLARYYEDADAEKYPPGTNHSELPSARTVLVELESVQAARRFLLGLTAGGGVKARAARAGEQV